MFGFAEEALRSMSVDKDPVLLVAVLL